MGTDALIAYVQGAANVMALTKWQRSVTALMEAADLHLFLRPPAPPDVKANNTNQRKRGASTIFTTTPPSRDRLSSDDFRIAARIRIGLPALENLPELCVCDRNLRAHWGGHIRDCNLRDNGGLDIARHDAVKIAVARKFTEIGVPAKIEPTRLAADNSRVDLLVTWGTDQWLIDFQVGINANLPMAERAKINDFAAKPYPPRLRNDFVPFIIHTSGGLGPAALAFLKSWGIRGPLGPKGQKVWLQEVKVAIAAAVCRGNAAITRERARAALAVMEVR